MIQRIQSVYLLVASLLLFLTASALYVMPEVTLAGFRLVCVIVASLIGLASLASIFFFGNRVLQAQIVNSLRLVGALLVIGLAAGLFAAGEMSTVIAGGALGVVGILIAPLIGLISLHLARKGIGRDIDLIRSMDRLR
jgi:hypothetical protein